MGLQQYYVSSMQPTEGKINNLEGTHHTNYSILRIFIQRTEARNWPRSKQTVIKKTKGGLTTLLMRGSSAIKNFSMLVFRITSVITLQGEQSKSPRHRVRERRARIGATQSRARGEGELTREGRSSAASARRAAGAGRRTMSSHRPRLLHRWRAGARRPHPAASSATSPTATPRLGLDRSPPLGSARPHRVATAA